MKSEVVCSKLMDELEHLDEGFRLDTITKSKKQELSRIEAALLKKQEESKRIVAANDKLRQERSELKAILSEERNHITNNIEAISTSALSTLAELKAAISDERGHIAKDFEDISLSAVNTIAKLKQDLSYGINESLIEFNRLRNQALQLGKEMRQFNEMIESTKWLKNLYTLVKGEEEVVQSQVRVIGITLIQAMLTWLDRHSQDVGRSLLLRPTMVNLIGELERWKV